MSDEPLPGDSIFVRWGRFQVSISGRFAIIAVLLGALAYFAGQLFGLM
jgi:hypothetical protein